VIPWLDRDLIVGPYLVLCTTQDEFDAVCDAVKVPRSPFVNQGSDAATHHLGRGDDGGHVCVVCVRPSDHDPISLCALLVHEAVHVWQRWCEVVGEHSPSVEFEAYAIQTISGRLMWAYRDQVVTPRSVTAQPTP